MTAAPEVAEGLALAADLLVERGWTRQRTGRSGDPRLTTLAAITVAVDRLHGSGPHTAEAHADCLDAVVADVYAQRSGHGDSIRSVSAWSRQRGQTGEQVVGGLRRIAARHAGVGA